MDNREGTDPSGLRLLARGHIAVLDGLRGLAILLVLFHHLWPYVWDNAAYKSLSMIKHVGWIGVDLFFVLSGFLITGILVDSMGKAGCLKNFIARRSLRVFPLYYFFLLISFTAVPAFLGWLSSDGVGSASEGATLPWFAFYVSNYLHFVHDPNVAAWIGTSPETVEIPERLAVTWSLCVEEQFYLVWPLMLLLIHRMPLRAIAVLLVVAIGCRTWVVASLENWQQVSYMATFCRADSLLLGAAAAIYLRHRNFSMRGWTIFSLAAGLLVLPAVMLWILGSGGRGNELFASFGYTFVAIGFVGWLGLAIGSKQASSVDRIRTTSFRHLEPWVNRLVSVPRRVFENRCLRWFGKYSYGLYLYHMIVLACFHAWRPVDTLPNGEVSNVSQFEPIGGSMLIDAPVRTLLVLVITMAVAWGSFHLLERPFLNLKRFFEFRESPRSVPAPERNSLALGMQSVDGRGLVQTTSREPCQ